MEWSRGARDVGFLVRSERRNQPGSMDAAAAQPACRHSAAAAATESGHGDIAAQLAQCKGSSPCYRVSCW